jgi:pSer/pThr/pTyr-binding forkhead associated (FHA) protein
MERLVLSWVNKPIALELTPGLNRIGRNPTNDTRVGDASISSFHCELMVHPDKVLVRDLSSTNGTFIDGVKVEEGALTVGQTLRLGTVDFKLEMVTVAETPRARQPPPLAPERSQGLLSRLTQTMRLPFNR